jgi:hypothetical protein
MPSRSNFDLMSGSESLPDLATHMPLGYSSDYPAVIELGNDATTSQFAPDPPAQTSCERGSPRTVLNVRRDSVLRMLSQQHSHDTAGLDRTATNSGRRSNPSVAGLDDCFALTTNISHIANNGSTETLHVTEPCPNPNDSSCADQHVARQPSPASRTALEHMRDQPHTVPMSSSNTSMLDRWHAQPRYQEPYTPIEDAHSSQVTRFHPSANAQHP